MIALGRFDSMTALYPMLLARLLQEADVVSPRGRLTHELRPASFTLSNPRASVLASKARAMNQAFAAAEFCWIMAGDDKLKPLVRFNSRMAEFADRGTEDDPTFFGAYGPPITEQLGYIIKTLQRDPDSRQAVLSIWRPSPPATRDVPCTLTHQFLRRRDRLEMIVSMRSSDAWLGIPYDVQTFTRIQIWVANNLEIDVGPYHHVAGSLHLYESDRDKAEAVVEEFRDRRQSYGEGLDDFYLGVTATELWDAVRRDQIFEKWDALRGWGPLAKTMREYLARTARAAR